MSQVRAFQRRAIFMQRNLLGYWLPQVMFWPCCARSQDVLATNQGVVQTAAGVEQVVPLNRSGATALSAKGKTLQVCRPVVIVKFGVDQQVK